MAGAPGASVAVPGRDVRAARVAVGALFFTNAVVFANVVPRLPYIKSSLGLSNAALGTAIAAGPLGALIAGAFASWFLVRWGSARVAVGSLVLMAANLLLISVAPSWGVLAAGLFLAGVCDSVADIANNAHGLRVQRRYGRSILNSFHGIWSVGAVFGGLVGSAAAGLDLALPLHLGVMAALSIVVVLATGRRLLPGPDDSEREPVHREAASSASRWWTQTSVIRALVVLGVVGSMGAAIEDAGATWGGVYLRDSLRSGAAVAGMAFVALQGMQALGRLTGDRWVTRFGERAVARAGAVVALAGMALALSLPSEATTVVGFGAAGLGISTWIPAAMHAADSIPGLPSGMALSIVGLVIRVGFFVEPPVVGVVADSTSLRWALLVVPFAAAVTLLAARALTTRVEPAPAGRPAPALAE
ncbi:fucose permease [Motilibacter peucedani]|uniref:Fucose permease n=1 Tax=Motilibacter peucedani TaxID=598650 RepID=A0A420XQ41_9ACTN|nr:MFS transporter [Motilibacter peucedani]RKS75403.1 fucose permease [Motilibacter peucedani]